MLYRTVQGDMWDLIAYKVYGQEQNFPLIMEANPEHIKTVIFGAGVLLDIPDTPVETSGSLPPWKRDD